MNRIFRMRRWNKKSNIFDILFPQTLSSNVLRRENGGVLETFLTAYDSHLENGRRHINHAYSRGDERHLEAHIRNTVLLDGFPLLLTVHTTVECEPTLDFNGTGEKPIISGAGEKIPGGQCVGTTMFLVWNEKQDAWVLLSSDNYNDVTKVLMPVVQEYTYTATHDGEATIVIPGFDANTCMLDINYGQTILRPGLDYEFVNNNTHAIHLLGFTIDSGEILFCKITSFTVTAKRGSFKYELDVQDYPITITEDGITTLAIPAEAIGTNYLEVNYGQTIMRNGLDYEYDENGTHLIFKFSFFKDDIVIFRSIRMVETNGDIVPNNFGATGNYRYSLNVLHEEYMATEDNITVIPVPNFNRRKDELSVIRDNKLLVYDVDYTIDTLDQVVLLTSSMNTNDMIYFTILQGAMMDVPNFNVIDASGDSGQHIHLDMSYNQLCNHYTLLVKLKHDLETAPTAKCIEGPAEPICDCFGNPVLGGYVAGSYLWLVYNEDKHQWYSLGHGQMDVTSTYPVFHTADGYANFFGNQPIELTYGDDPNMIGETVIEHGLGRVPAQITVQPVEPPNMLDGKRTTIGDIWSHADETYLYVGNTGNATSGFHWIVSTATQTTDLRTYLENAIAELKARPGKFETRLIAYTVESDNPKVIHLTDFNGGVDKILLVNYGQTVLRENVDYIITATGIELVNLNLVAGDILQFLIVLQAAD